MLRPTLKAADLDRLPAVEGSFKTPWLVVGAGVVGLACALRLQAAGLKVVVLDREGVAAGASRGNAGALAFSDVLPLASPGILRQAPRWLLDPLGPLALRPGYLLPMLPWLWRFWRASQPAQVERSARAQAGLLSLSAQAWPALLELAGASEMLREGGNLHLYDNEASWRAALPGWQQRAGFGIGFEHFTGAEAIARYQPGLSPAFRHATFVPQWQTVDDPLELTRRLAQSFVARGGKLLRGEVRAFASRSYGLKLQLADGTLVKTEHLLLCAGAWSHQLAACMGEQFPLETERGYNTTLPAGSFPLQRQLTFCNHGFVVTPIAGGVRVGGAVEFAGLDAPPNYQRADALLAKAKRFLPELNTQGGTQWMGCRPSLPDSRPVIGASPADARLFYAFGHGHLGLTQAAATAELALDWALHRSSPIDLGAFAPQRFL